MLPWAFVSSFPPFLHVPMLSWGEHLHRAAGREGGEPWEKGGEMKGATSSSWPWLCSQTQLGARTHGLCPERARGSLWLGACHRQKEGQTGPLLSPSCLSQSERHGALPPLSSGSCFLALVGSLCRSGLVTVKALGSLLVARCCWGSGRSHSGVWWPREAHKPSLERFWLRLGVGGWGPGSRAGETEPTSLGRHLGPTCWEIRKYCLLACGSSVDWFSGSIAV